MAEKSKDESPDKALARSSLLLIRYHSALMLSIKSMISHMDFYNLCFYMKETQFDSAVKKPSKVGTRPFCSHSLNFSSNFGHYSPVLPSDQTDLVF